MGEIKSRFSEVLESMDLSEREMVMGEQLINSINDKRRWQEEWRNNELSINDIGIEGGVIQYAGAAIGETDGEGRNDAEENFLGININARNFEISKSMLISTPPVAIATPVDDDPANKLAALACEALVGHVRKEYVLDDHISNWIHNVYQYGVGWLKQVYSANRGFFISFDVETGESKQEGDLVYSTPRPWDIFFDPTADHHTKHRWLKERMFVPVSDAVNFFDDFDPEFIKSLELAETDIVGAMGNESYFFNFKRGMVEVFEHWEPGLPENGFLGRLVYHIRNGKILKEYKNENGVLASPCSFDVKGYPGIQKARLPYTFLGHTSVSGSVWCRTPTAIAARKQWVLNACYGNLLKTAEAMGIPRLVCDKASLGEDNENPVSDDILDVVGLNLDESGGQGAPWILQAAQASGDIRYMIQDLAEQIDDDWGINQAMRGKQDRETSGYLNQLSIQQGSQIKGDFFRKYVGGVTDVHKLSQSYIKKHWTVKRKVEVVGENGKVFVNRLQGADIASGFDLTFELGTGFALDPITRQEQIKKNFELYTLAGVDPRKILRMLRNSDHRGLYETFDLASQRAEKILDKLKRGENVPVRGPEDHIGIALYMREYVMGSEYFDLSPDIQSLIDRHVAEREQQIAKAAAARQPMPAEV